MEKSKISTHKIVFTALMAAVVYVVTLFRIPFLGSKVHFANSMCLLAGMFLGPAAGGIAAGLGSALYDALAGGYGIVDCVITFVSKFAMAWICAVIVGQGDSKVKIIAGDVIGSLSYVALYMLKHFVYQAFVYGYPMSTVGAVLLSKLPASLINALFSIIATPIIYAAFKPALRKTGLLEKINNS